MEVLNAKEQFCSLLGTLNTKVVQEFVCWLDYQVAFYKISGNMPLGLDVVNYAAPGTIQLQPAAYPTNVANVKVEPGTHPAVTKPTNPNTQRSANKRSLEQMARVQQNLLLQQKQMAMTKKKKLDPGVRPPRPPQPMGPRQPMLMQRPSMSSPQQRMMSPRQPMMAPQRMMAPRQPGIAHQRGLLPIRPPFGVQRMTRPMQFPGTGSSTVQNSMVQMSQAQLPTSPPPIMSQQPLPVVSPTNQSVPATSTTSLRTATSPSAQVSSNSTTLQNTEEKSHREKSDESKESDTKDNSILREINDSLGAENSKPGNAKTKGADAGTKKNMVPIVSLERIAWPPKQEQPDSPLSPTAQVSSPNDTVSVSQPTTNFSSQENVMTNLPAASSKPSVVNVNVETTSVNTVSMIEKLHSLQKHFLSARKDKTPAAISSSLFTSSATLSSRSSPLSTSSNPMMSPTSSNPMLSPPERPPSADSLFISSILQESTLSKYQSQQQLNQSTPSKPAQAQNSSLTDDTLFKADTMPDLPFQHVTAPSPSRPENLIVMSPQATYRTSFPQRVSSPGVTYRQSPTMSPRSPNIMLMPPQSPGAAFGGLRPPDNPMVNTLPWSQPRPGYAHSNNAGVFNPMRMQLPSNGAMNQVPLQQGMLPSMRFLPSSSPQRMSNQPSPGLKRSDGSFAAGDSSNTSETSHSVCKICQKHFSSLSLLLCHTEEKHSENPPTFTCEVRGCGKKYQHKSTLQRHMHQAHGDASTNNEPMAVKHQ